MAQTHKMANAITERAAEGGITGLESTEVARLESAELGMLATHTDISGGSAKLKASLKCFWNAWVSSNATFMMAMNTGVAFVMDEGCEVTSMRSGGSGVAAIMGRGSGMAAMAGRDSRVAAMMG